jgi:hypothetical protein
MLKVALVYLEIDVESSRSKMELVKDRLRIDLLKQSSLVKSWNDKKTKSFSLNRSSTTMTSRINAFYSAAEFSLHTIAIPLSDSQRWNYLGFSWD